MCEGPNRTQGVLLYNYLPSSFEIRYLTECHTLSYDVCMEVRWVCMYVMSMCGCMYATVCMDIRGQPGLLVLTFHFL